MLELKAEKFYGHANMKRAAQTEAFKDCRWIDPDTGTQEYDIHSDLKYLVEQFKLLVCKF